VLDIRTELHSINNAGQIAFTTVVAVSGPHGRIRVTSVTDPTVKDVSDAVFAIQ
jgi:hypothetical protein